MRVYRLKTPSSLDAVEHALRTLDSRAFPGPLDAGCTTEEGVRIVKLERLERSASSIEALIKISYKTGKRKLWSDLYVFKFVAVAGELEVAARRVSGLGRTDPDFIIDLLARTLAQQSATSALRLRNAGF